MMTRIPKSQKFLEIRLLHFLFTIPHKIVFKDFVYFVGTDNLINKFLLVRIISIAYTIPCQKLYVLNLSFIGVVLGRRLEENICSQSFYKSGQVINERFTS